MEIKGLQLGNWVLDKIDGKPHRVCEIGDWYGVVFEHEKDGEEDTHSAPKDVFEPIVLNGDILVANGFKKTLNKDKFSDCYDWDAEYEFIQEDKSRFVSIKHWEDEYRPWSIRVDDQDLESVGHLNFNHVHELQNFLTLCGVEKDIEL